MVKSAGDAVQYGALAACVCWGPPELLGKF